MTLVLDLAMDGAGSAVRDRSPYGHHCTITGGVTWGGSSRGHTLEFDGTGYATASANGNLQNLLNLDEVTVLCWADIANPSGSVTDVLVAHYNPTDNQRQWVLRCGGNNIRIVLSQDGTVTASQYKDYRTNNDIWLTPGMHHVGFTFQRGDLQLYENGTAQTAVKTNDGPITSLHPTTSGVVLGDFGNAPTSDILAGQLGNVKVWRRALSPQEVFEEFTKPVVA